MNKNTSIVAVNPARRLEWLVVLALIVCAQSMLVPRVAHAADVPYPNMPEIAPIGVRIGHYLPIPENARGPAVDPAKGYRIEEMGKGLYMITDNAIQSMFMVYETGVVVLDAPQAYAGKIRAAIREVTDRPITHLIYSHSHADHIGGARTVGGNPIIIAQEETKRLLARDNDPERPLPTVTFKDKYTLKVGSQVLELSYHGDAHEPGNTYIYAPAQQTLMVIDLVFPGWMPWRRLAVAHEVQAYFDQVELIRKLPFKKIVGGHVARSGTHEDVELQSAFLGELKAAAKTALATNKPGEGLDPNAKDNPWAIFDDYIDRVAIQCVNTLTPKWKGKLGGFDAFIWDQCYSMEQSLRID
jgi:glyoxylase-like metal-dependent hydrolase (beta-lactamase superfamily II)